MRKPSDDPPGNRDNPAPDRIRSGYIGCGNNWLIPGTGWQTLMAGCASILFMAVAIATLLAAHNEAAADRALRDRGIEATATITGLDNRNARVPKVDVTYLTTEGEIVTLTGQQPGGQFYLGRKISLIFNPDNPRDVTYGMRGEIGGVSAFTGIFGVALLLFGIWQTIRASLGLSHSGQWQP